MKPEEPARPRVCELSVVIKALNEERNIERTLRSVQQAIEGLAAEVILADSLSSDSTVDLAKQFPITIVQLKNGGERCCGIGAQLGYQHACGRFILVIDGDMELDKEWLLAAMRHLRVCPDLAGVGGVVEDMNLDNIEFRARKLRKPKSSQPGEVDRLYGGGLYRCEAIEQVAYLTHRSLHACEELELGLRLLDAGWRLQRLAQVSIRHHGHQIPMWTLVRARWRSRYVNGAGELLRASLGKPWFGRAMASQALLLTVLIWWTALAILVLGVLAGGRLLPWLGAALLAPVVAMVLRKRSVTMGLYSILVWWVEAAGLLRGVFSRPSDPTRLIDSVVVAGVACVPAAQAVAHHQTRDHDLGAARAETGRR